MGVETTLFDLTGRVALLTGASKGMGLYMAEGLAEHGARVVVSSRKLDQCEAAVAQINEKCGEERAIPIACNIGYKEQLEALVAETRSHLGPIDILVANAGVNPFYGPMSKIPDSAFDKIMASNVRSNHWLCQMVAPDMVEKGRGSMMITASTGAFNASEMLGTYAISKLADIALARNLALEYGPERRAGERDLPGPHQDGLRPRPVGQPGSEGERGDQHAAAPPRRTGGPEGRGRVPRLGRQRLHDGAGPDGVRRHEHVELIRGASGRQPCATGSRGRAPAASRAEFVPTSPETSSVRP